MNQFYFHADVLLTAEINNKKSHWECGLKLWLPTNSGSCSENGVSYEFGHECHSLRESLRECLGIPIGPPRMACSLRERFFLFFQSWGGSQASEFMVKCQNAPKERGRRHAGNGRPKGCFWRVRFFSARVRSALGTLEDLRMN